MPSASSNSLSASTSSVSPESTQLFGPLFTASDTPSSKPDSAAFAASSERSTASIRPLPEVRRAIALRRATTIAPSS